MLQTENGYLLEINFLQKEDLSDEELYTFCVANQHVRIERNEKDKSLLRPLQAVKRAATH